ncbi:PQ loop repeat-domain-containing protein [Gorgonomyces haynaldii]|nr:PQ loop repeat-domain-containing protein [Gorgonomyces haynaldii]
MKCANFEDMAPVQWIEFLFGECAYTPRDVISFLLGYCSIVCWLFAQFPQLIQNYKNGSAESLSLMFISNWLLGDLCNLVGGIMTKQLPFQIYLAVYFCFIDFSLFCQTVYYNYWLHQDSEETQPLLANSYLIFALATLAFPTDSLQVLTDPTEDTTYAIGRVFAWICAGLYFSSRIPQIYWNYKRQSVEGLSIFMFGFAVLGNITYAGSILIKSLDATFLMGALPYLIGTAGTLTFDCIIFGQYVLYESRK